MGMRSVAPRFIVWVEKHSDAKTKQLVLLCAQQQIPQQITAPISRRNGAQIQANKRMRVDIPSSLAAVRFQHAAGGAAFHTLARTHPSVNYK